MKGWLLEFREFRLEAVEVERFLDELLIHFAEPEVIFKAAEPLEPGAFAVTAKLRLLGHNNSNFN